MAVQLACSEKRVTRNELAAHLGRSLKLAIAELHDLVNKGILERHDHKTVQEPVTIISLNTHGINHITT